jgi:hypothetical protein
MQIDHDKIDPFSVPARPLDHHSGQIRRARPNVEEANVLPTRRLDHREEMTGKGPLTTQQLIDVPQVTQTIPKFLTSIVRSVNPLRFATSLRKSVRQNHSSPAIPHPRR